MASYLDKTGLSTLVDKLKKYIKDSSDIVKPYSSIYEFPGIGKEKILYIDLSTDTLYRWDDINVKYYCIGSDYNNIKVINGGDSSSSN